MTTADLALIAFLVYSLAVLAGIYYVVRALLRAADRNRMRIAVLQGRTTAEAPSRKTPKVPSRITAEAPSRKTAEAPSRKTAEAPSRTTANAPSRRTARAPIGISVLTRLMSRLKRMNTPKLNRKQEPSMEPPVDPVRVDDSHLDWLDVKRRKFLRRNGEDAADAAIILGGLTLAQQRAHIPGTPAPVIPAPMLSEYRDYFGRWELFKVVRFTSRITARLVDEPAGHIVYGKFARKVLNDWQFKGMLDSIDKFAPERVAKVCTDD